MVSWSRYLLFSKGEEKCSQILSKLKIPFSREYQLVSLPRKRFDFFFHYNERRFLLEFDGQQHFFAHPYFDRRQSFSARQKNDIIKTQTALKEGKSLIRIDYTQINQIEKHLLIALTKGNKLYLSTPDLYRYITIHVS